ncbi:MAG: RtcB family protein [Bacteroidota bacterium]
MEQHITGTTLQEWGVPQGPAVGLGLKAMEKLLEHNESTAEARFRKALENPQDYLEHEVFAEFTQELTKPPKVLHSLHEEALPFQVYGEEGIEDGAKNQMITAMRLPIARAGALMPDAHQGYGLPIGGVLATENSVIPYGVGVDIGCRMCLSIFPMPTEDLDEHNASLRGMIMRNSKFGREVFKEPMDHEILSSHLFDEIPKLKELQPKAAKQIGSSGGGNHFVELGEVTIQDEENDWGLPVGKYLGLLSHSGSRGMGATIANHYTKMAMQECPLPSEARHLAWLDLDSELGQEYWLAMNLAGDYASACHHQIHQRVARSLKVQPAAMVENHHNFAWKEKNHLGEEWIVHRKGATPAGEGVLGIIPGSMTAPGFVVKGKGVEASISSAAHGAGRRMSRTKAKKNITMEQWQKQLKEHQVTLISAGLDEAPDAYKDIREVMEAQSSLVQVLAEFQPRIVRMCGDKRFREVD